MYMVREVLNCRPGKVGALAKRFRELGEVMKAMKQAPFRIYTDVVGAPFWTLVLERDYTSLDELPALESQVMGDARAQKIMEGYHDLVVQGHREVYKAES